MAKARTIARRKAARRRPLQKRPWSESVFLNFPFDTKYEPLFLALVAGTCGFGLVPTSTLEIPSSDRRLNRILSLIRASRYSLHDLSRVEVDPSPPPTPRFNMPFELGLAVVHADVAGGKHEWVVLEAEEHRLNKSLGDLNGTDPRIHGGTPEGMLRCLANALVTEPHQPTLTELRAIHADLRKVAVKIRADFGTLFEARPFHELVAYAMRSASKHVPSLVKP